MYTVLAVALAVIGSACNAWAAVLQHHVVDATVSNDVNDGSRRMSPRRILTLLRSPRWWFAISMVVLGAIFHIIGLALAPITLVQPIGVLGLVFALLIASRQRRSWPGGRVWAGAATTVVGIAAFVVVAADQVSHTDTLHRGDIVWVGLVLLLVATAFGVVGAKGPTWLRCLAWAAAASTVFGLASALLRTVTVLVRADTPWVSPIMMGLGASLAVCYTGGGWLAQQAYASGPPETVMACLTVVDPLVAVCFGIVVLREGVGITTAGGFAMAAAGLVAAAGAVVLARHHPDATKAYQPRS